jgi:hypothetical protein
MLLNVKTYLLKNGFYKKKVKNGVYDNGQITLVFYKDLKHLTYRMYVINSLTSEHLETHSIHYRRGDFRMYKLLRTIDRTIIKYSKNDF